MAKGNFWTRSVKGRLGDMVFYKSKGEQMTRSYNGNPANPRTDKQLVQRVKWVNTCNAYAFLRPFIADTFIKRPQDQNNFNAFVSANVGLNHATPKADAESNKRTKTATSAPYIVANGSLSGFPSSVITIDANPSAGGKEQISVVLNNNGELRDWISEKAQGGPSVSVTFGELWDFICSFAKLPNSHFGCLLINADDNFNFSNYAYFELYNGLDVPPLNFVENSEGLWDCDYSYNLTPDSLLSLGFVQNSEKFVISVSLNNSVSDNGAVASFRCEYAPTINTQRAQLVLSEGLTEYIAEMSDPVNIPTLIQSWRRSATDIEDEQVFNG